MMEFVKYLNSPGQTLWTHVSLYKGYNFLPSWRLFSLFSSEKKGFLCDSCSPEIKISVSVVRSCGTRSITVISALTWIRKSSCHNCRQKTYRLPQLRSTMQPRRTLRETFYRSFHETRSRSRSNWQASSLGDKSAAKLRDPVTKIRENRTMHNSKRELILYIS